MDWEALLDYPPLEENGGSQMSGTVTPPVEVPRETIEGWCRQIRWQTGWPIKIQDTTDIAIRRATELGMLNLIEEKPCS